MGQVIKILFVCTGNICRSAMAHHYMQKRVKDLKIEDKYWIDSCGTYAVAGENATESNRKVMEKYGVDVTMHHATPMQEVDLESYDIILTFTKYHKQTVLQYKPQVKDKIFTLREYIHPTTLYQDIDDPWGFHITVYEACAKEIVEDVDQLIEKLEGSDSQ